METASARTGRPARTAAVWAVLRRELDRHAGRELTVLDVGGGTGGFAVPLAEAGHHVTVIDASPDALADADPLQGQHGLPAEVAGHGVGGVVEVAAAVDR
ncbi:methyltransferase domain-containing protein, partial [Actinoplanes sp. NPDC024001]|uniref:class I SAM-dependent methyltransferase n=1 Tax=Actinoplanes sp. NPDC024001 TaxID=3154598 RepID=UPI0033E05672